MLPVTPRSKYFIQENNTTPGEDTIHPKVIKKLPPETLKCVMENTKYNLEKKFILSNSLTRSEKEGRQKLKLGKKYDTKR